MNTVNTTNTMNHNYGEVLSSDSVDMLSSASILDDFLVLERDDWEQSQPDCYQEAEQPLRF